MNTLLTELAKKQNKTAFTENGAITNQSTLDACLDLFGTVGSMRGRNEDCYKLFLKAYAENPLKALKILFWTRDVRGGAGERSIFRYVIRQLAIKEPKVVEANLSLFAEYGRWDDLFTLDGTPVEAAAFHLLASQLVIDAANLVKGEGGKVTLAAKWLPSVNTSSKSQRALGRKFARYFFSALDLPYCEKTYRQYLSSLRKHLDIVERKMCAGQWESIDFEKIPSRAAMIYRKAFARHEEARYAKYLEDVASGKKEIKSSTLYPYDIVRNAHYDSSKSLDLQWKALPNYVEPFNGLVVCDTSGSMYSGAGSVAPILVSISLALYIAERNEGAFKDHFITFSSNPRLQKVVGSTIHEKYNNLHSADWGMNTDLMAVFREILSVAEKNNVPANEMPQKIFIVSDMGFDAACKSNKRTNFEQIKKIYSQAGYVLPELVFWNVNASVGNCPITQHDTGTCLVSGCSPAILKSVLAGEIITPIDVMNAAIESERYAAVKI